MSKVLEKVERRLGEKLFIKGDRCAGPKCAMLRRSSAPGMHGKARRREPSEFGQLFREKQKVRYIYGLDDKDVKRYITIAEAKKGTFALNVLKLLERRLDNVVYRLGFADSRRMARQIVTHGHITINGKTASIPSLQVKRGSVIGIKPRAIESVCKGIDEKLKSVEAPRWVSLDKAKKTGTIIGEPEAEDVQFTVDITKIKEFYSR
ncbi:MAG: 30S ribosomal protein S4 [bacterium]|nr:30S ribosomal protein S4 [bacterium]MDZ4285918.1 30S ribosomal protein S4 [Candidatus Sungbacteria bacterium]